MFKSECIVLLENWCSDRYFISMFHCVAEKYMGFDLNDKGDIGTYARILLHFGNQTIFRQSFCLNFHLQWLTKKLPSQVRNINILCSILDMMGLKRMLEKLGLAKTHLELKRMMLEVTGETSKDTISYHDFLNMMLGKRNAILKLWVQIPATLKRLLVASNYKFKHKINLESEKVKCPSIHFLHLLYPHRLTWVYPSCQCLIW